MVLLVFKIKILTFTLMIWGYISKTYEYLYMLFLYFVYKIIPDEYVINFNEYSNINIIKAYDDKGNSIKNKLQLFINLNLEKNHLDDQYNKIDDINTFLKILETKYIYILYIINYDYVNEFLPFINFNKNFDFKIQNFNKIVRAMSIDFEKKYIDKNNIHETHSDRERLVFGSVIF